MIGIVLFFLIVGNAVALFPVSQALSWALSVKDGSWTVKAFDAAVPGAGQVLSFVMDPQGAILGEGLGQLKEAVGPEAGTFLDCIISPQGCATQVTLEQVAKQNPEAFGVLSEVLAVKAQLQGFGFTSGDIELDKEGNIQIISDVDVEDNELHAIGNIVGKDLPQNAFKVANVAFSKKDGEVTVQMKANGMVRTKIKREGKEEERIYFGMKEGSILKFNEAGDLVEADIKPLVGKDFFKVGEFNVRKVYEPENQKNEVNARVQFKDGIITLSGNYDTRFQLMNEKEWGKGREDVEIINKEGVVRIQGKDISGNDFYFGDAEVRGIWILRGGIVVENDGILVKEGTEFSQRYGAVQSFTVGKKPAKMTYKKYNPMKEDLSYFLYEPIITGEDIRMQDSEGKNLVLSGSLGMRNDYFNLYGKTELSEIDLEDGEVITKFKTDKDLELHLEKGECSIINCIVQTEGRMAIRTGGNAHIEVENPGGTVKEIYSKKITDGSIAEVTQGNVKIRFSKEPFSVEGNLEDTNIGKVESEFVRGGKTRIVQAEAVQGDGKHIVFSECPPCDLHGQFYNPVLGIRVNALNVDRKFAREFIETQSENLGVKVPYHFGYFNDEREEQLIENHLEVFNEYPDIDPNMFMAAAFQEGENKFIDEVYYKNPENAVSGFGHLGLDKFGEDANQLKERGYLDENFKICASREEFKARDCDYLPVRNVNERNEEVTSADFVDLKTALRAFGATLSERKDEFLDNYAIERSPQLKRSWNEFQGQQQDAIKMLVDSEVKRFGEKERRKLVEWGIDPNEEEWKYQEGRIKQRERELLRELLVVTLRKEFIKQEQKAILKEREKLEKQLTKKEIAYGTYVQYNTRPYVAMQIFSAGSKNLLPNEKLPEKVPSGGSNPKYNAMRMALTAELFEKTGLFDVRKQQSIVVAQK